MWCLGGPEIQTSWLNRAFDIVHFSGDEDTYLVRRYFLVQRVSTLEAFHCSKFTHVCTSLASIIVGQDCGSCD